MRNRSNNFTVLYGKLLDRFLANQRAGFGYWPWRFDLPCNKVGYEPRSTAFITRVRIFATLFLLSFEKRYAFSCHQYIFFVEVFFCFIRDLSSQQRWIRKNCFWIALYTYVFLICSLHVFLSAAWSLGFCFLFLICSLHVLLSAAWSLGFCFLCLKFYEQKTN